ncbi:hypothetical protein K435DRAFT_928003, partial [Dendrothele bispora CBS 962.96]
DDIFALVDGLIATGKGAFHAGSQVQSTDNSTMADVDVEEPATTEELITTSSVTTTPAPVSRKRIRADTESPEPPSVSRPPKSRRSTDAVDNVAAAIRDLGSSFQVKPSSIMAATTPERRQAAIALMEDDGDLSDDDQAAALQLFSENKHISDTYLSTKKKSLRTKYLSNQLLNQIL